MLVPTLAYQPQQLNGSIIQANVPTPGMPVIAQNGPAVMPSAEHMKAFYAPNMAVPKKPEVKSVWASANPQKRQFIQQMGESYKAFLNNSKTDLTAVNSIIQRAMTEGFQPWPENAQAGTFRPQPGEKYFRVNRDRSVHLMVIGQQPIAAGFKMTASHIDSPHVALKAKPLQDGAGDFAIFKTRVHGGIKPHQWTQRTLALVGKVVKPDGQVINIDIGNKPGDPVFIIPELAPHVDDGSARNPKLEQLNAIVGSNEPDSLDQNAEQSVSSQVEQVLYQTFGITREDLVHAQLALVPAEISRDVGLDRSMISGYGSDDKSSAYAAMEGLISATKTTPIPQKTMIASCYGNEEIGSWNSYGAKSDDTRMMLAEIMKYTQGQFDELELKRAFKNSLIVSTDVTTAIDPVRPDAEDTSNAAKLGFGPAVAHEGALTQTPEASAAFARMLNGVQTQTHTFNQDKGGGGTLGNYIATQNNADVVEFGVPVLGMHSPIEVVHKADLYEFTTALRNYFINN